MKLIIETREDKDYDVTFESGSEKEMIRMTREELETALKTTLAKDPIK